MTGKPNHYRERTLKIEKKRQRGILEGGDNKGRKLNSKNFSVHLVHGPDIFHITDGFLITVKIAVRRFTFGPNLKMQLPVWRDILKDMAGEQVKWLQSLPVAVVNAIAH